MFTAALDPFAYTHPWDIPFEARLAMLTAGTPRAAYLYARPDNGTFRYRAYNVAQALTVGRRGSAAWFTEDDLDHIGRVLDQCDVLVLCRNSLYTERLARIAALARRRGLPILFDVDDLVFDPAYIHSIMNTLGHDADADEALTYWFSYVGRVSATFGLCDAALVTNEALAVKARQFSGKPARIVRNALNREQQEISDQIFGAKARSGWARDGRLHLGYFSGSASHNRDFAMIAETIGRLMDVHPTLHLRIVGILDRDASLARHADRVECVAFTDFVNLQREIGAVEVNLVPLLANDFTDCKSELKWFEASCVGSLTVASPTHAYRGAIEHGRTGWLCPAHRWQETLTEVISVAADPAARRQVLEAARTAALDRFGWERQADSIADSLFADLR